MRISDWSSDVCSSDLPFVDGVRRYVHQAGDLLGIFVLVNVPQRFNLRGGQQAEVIVGVALHGVGIEHHESKSRRSEEHTSELKSLMRISYDVFCLKKKNTQSTTETNTDKEVNN